MQLLLRQRALHLSKKLGLLLQTRLNLVVEMSKLDIVGVLFVNEVLQQQNLVVVDLFDRQLLKIFDHDLEVFPDGCQIGLEGLPHLRLLHNECG